MLPVTLAAPGSRPIRLLIKIKKKKVKSKGENFSCFEPMLSFIISSLTNKTSGSMNACKPVGATSDFLYVLETRSIIKNNKKTDISIDITFFVIDRSIISAPLLR